MVKLGAKQLIVCNSCDEVERRFLTVPGDCTAADVKSGENISTTVKLKMASRHTGQVQGAGIPMSKF